MTITCIKGSHKLGLVKNRVYPVLEVREFENQPCLLLQMSDRRLKVYVPMVHKNRVQAGEEFNVNTGDPTRKARMRLNK